MYYYYYYFKTIKKKGYLIIYSIKTNNKNKIKIKK